MDTVYHHVVPTVVELLFWSATFWSTSWAWSILTAFRATLFLYETRNFSTILIHMIVFVDTSQRVLICCSRVNNVSEV